MAAQIADNVDADGSETENEEREEYVWVNVSPDTRITGTPVELIYSGELGTSVEQNDTSFGVVFEDAEVDGTIYRNEDKDGEGPTMIEGDNGDEYHTTDYKVADPEDNSTTLVDGTLIVSSPNATYKYEEVEDFDESKILVWYNGMSGQIVGRGLDFNGRPYARYTDDGYLIKGLFQAAEGWRNTSNKKSMVDADKAPRVAREPILRSDIDTVSIRIKRSEQNPKAYWVDMGPSADEEFSRDDSMLYNADADDILAENDIDMQMFHGDGWQDKPANAQSNEAEEDNPFEGLSIDDSMPEHMAALNTPERKFINSVVADARDKELTADQVNLVRLAGKFNKLFEEAPNIEALNTALEAELSE